MAESNNGRKRKREKTANSTPYPQLLHLFLGLDSTTQITTKAWEWLSVKDSIAVAGTSKSIRQRLTMIEYTRCRDGSDYLVPYPGFPGLLQTANDLQLGAGLFAHQLASLRAMHWKENPTDGNHFGTLRGGILGDAPGLGKTVTMMALIANTAGRRPLTPPEFWDTSRVEEGWRLLRNNDTAKQNILAALKPVRQWVWSAFRKGSVELETYRRLEVDVSPPYKDDRFATIRELELYVYRTLQFVPRSALELFRSNVLELKAGLDKRNRKLLMSEQGKRLQQERMLIPSSGTLIIVPDSLLEHWANQIQAHLHLSFFEDPNDENLRNIIYIDGVGDFVDARTSLRSTNTIKSVPAPYLLGQYFIVVTTFSRCNAQFQAEVAAGRINNSNKVSRTTKSFSRRRKQTDESSGSRSPFLQIRWLRLVVDEGHELGQNEAENSVTQYIHEIFAERRWVLSGTPTTGDEDDEHFSSRALDQIQRLLKFLRHPMYGNLPTESPYLLYNDDEAEEKAKEQAKELWVEKVKDPFMQRKEAGREELFRVLREIMVMHRKEDLCLPKPIFHQAEVNVPVPESFQEQMRMNIESAEKMLETVLHSEEFQSAVDKAQATYIVESIRSAQKKLRERGGALTAANTAISSYENTDVNDDRRPTKAVVYASEKSNLLSVSEQLYRILGNFENIAELYDSSDVGDLGSELSRFRNGFREMKVCPVCQRENDLAIGGRRGVSMCRKQLLEVVWKPFEGSSCRFLIEPERIVQPVPVIEGGSVDAGRLGGEPLSSYANNPRVWRIGDILEVDIRDAGRHPLLPPRWSEETWETYGSKRCLERAKELEFQGVDWYFGPLPAPDRPDGRCVVKLEKFQACGKFHNHSRWYEGPKFRDAPIQRVKEDVFILSLDAGLSHGLDLSFVTHIFLLEPIEDAALLEQITSRAHRLGATGPVVVDTVNTFFQLSKETEQAMEPAVSTGSGQASAKKKLDEDKAKALTKICCVHCFRQFESYAKAEYHEQTHCPRNPDIIATTDVDRFHLSSVYRAIKPPRAVE